MAPLSYDDPDQVKRVSQQMDADGERLWAWGQDIDPYAAKDFSMGLDISGGLAITSLQLTLGDS